MFAFAISTIYVLREITGPLDTGIFIPEQGSQRTPPSETRKEACVRDFFSVDLFLLTCFLSLCHHSTVRERPVSGPACVCPPMCKHTREKLNVSTPGHGKNLSRTEHFLQDHDFRAGRRKLLGSPWNSWAGRADFQSSADYKKLQCSQRVLCRMSRWG